MSQQTTIAELLFERANREPNRVLYRYLDDQNSPIELTRRDLHRRATALAGEIAALASPGERALLVYAPGLDFIEAFFACQYAGIVPVPVAVPVRPRDIERAVAIATDAQASLFLTTSTLHGRMKGVLPAPLEGLRWVATDDAKGSPLAKRHAAGPDALAFLQYTSGSTGAPKGVMVSQRNVLENTRMIKHAFAADRDTRTLSWLPHSHDMGLIGTILVPLVCDAESTLMSPMSFLRDPMRWLRAISKYKIVATGGPTFGYAHCVARARGKEILDVDLSSWRVAFVGAEPVRPATLSSFAETFAALGFRKEAFLPCYGLAEATLLVSGRTADRPPSAVTRTTSKGVEPSATVRCGPAAAQCHVRIVDAETLCEVQPGEAGEIWVAGPHVATGYWNRAELSEETFRATLAGEATSYLRTGDLGYLHDGELVVSGRLKDLIVLRGHNHFPQDIEQTVEQTSLHVRRGSVAAFSLWDGEEEHLAVIAEVRRVEDGGAQKLLGDLRQAISERHGVKAQSIILARPGALPKTPSGKIQRRQARLDYLEGKLTPLAESVLTLPGAARKVVGA